MKRSILGAFTTMILAAASGCGEAGGGDGGMEQDGSVTPRDGGGMDAAALPDGATLPDAHVSVDAGPSECDDGIDNDGDGYVDWQMDLGCWGPGDRTEAARPRAEESGWTTFDVGAGSVVVYVSADGDDANDGLTAATAVQTLARGADLVRDGENDFLLLRRGDTWRDQDLYRFESGRDATHPLVVASYGESTERPRLEVREWLINHDGRARSFVALMGLHVVVFPIDPADPDFNGGDGHGGIRYVGNGTDLLVEDCHFEYGEIVVQSISGEHYEDVEIRRNIVEKSYHADTCLPGDPHGDSTYRPSGMYASHVNRLTIEGNLFDHNGWNEDVASACATIYNHNLYLNGNDVVIRDNLLTRASSIHIKLRSDTTGDMTGLVVENNFFAEGEIGVSLGGNTSDPYRFTSSTIRRNVLSHIGRSRPTTRTLAWGIGVSDNDGVVIEDNHFLEQSEPEVRNSYAINVEGGTDRGVTIEGNLFYRIQNRSLRAQPSASHEAIVVRDNTFADPDQGSCLVEHEGAFDAYTYENNRYYSSADADRWFCTGAGPIGIDAWRTSSGEASATALSTLDFPEPTRGVESYAETLGFTPTLEGFVAEARQQSRLTWREPLTADALNTYIRAGF